MSWLGGCMVEASLGTLQSWYWQPGISVAVLAALQNLGSPYGELILAPPKHIFN